MRVKHREVSRELMKRQLLQELYPIPRQRKLSPRHRQKSTDIHSQFMNTLEFLDFHLVETAILKKFEEKMNSELQLSHPTLDFVLEGVTADRRVQNIFKKLATTQKGDQ